MFIDLLVGSRHAEVGGHADSLKADVVAVVVGPANHHFGIRELGNVSRRCILFSRQSSGILPLRLHCFIWSWVA